MHTLWLASWYPHRTEPFNGDFIQRHALSLATRSPVTVIHVAKGNIAEVTLNRTGDLTERIVYVRASMNKFIAQLRAFRAYLKAYKDHVGETGKPALIHVHVCMNAGIFALWLKWTRRIPYVVTEHYSVYIPGTPHSFETRTRLYRLVNKAILRGASGVHCVSHSLLEHLERITSVRCPTVIPNAVDTRLFRPGAGSPGLFRFIHVSNFTPGKHVAGILDAFSLLRLRRRDWELVLVGPAGEDIKTYKDELTRVLRWTGEVTHVQVAEHLKLAGALVMFSHFESQPCIILEALCCGVPVISTPAGGIPEVLSSTNGKLVPTDDVEALANALEQMMLGYAGYKKARIAATAAAAYGYAVIGEQLAAFYEKATHA